MRLNVSCEIKEPKTNCILIVIRDIEHNCHDLTQFVIPLIELFPIRVARNDMKKLMV